MGSPPHTRGTRCHQSLLPLPFRITPAYTGNTQFRSFNHPLPEDHPRIHGEHYTAVKGQASDEGSPPHTRGTLVFYISSIALIRITPAYTGNTGLKSAWGSVKQDHPRIHGEHHTELTQIESVQGSPPHTRGTLSSFSLRQFFCRITPAYTGNTQARG